MVVGSPTKLNLIPSGVMPVVYINQGDAGYDKEFLIYNGDSPYNVPSGVSATIRGTKADGYGVTEAAALTEGSNLVTVTITEQMVAADGANIYELVFVDTDGLRIATINMVWAVKADALGDAVISESDLDYASQVMDQLQSVSAFKNQLDANTGGLAAETAARIAADSAETAARTAADTALQSAINAESVTRAAKDNQLQAEIDQLVAPSGAAPSAAEIQNARIGADGVTYDTLGNAIRGQVNDLKNHIDAAYPLLDASGFEWTLGKTINTSGAVVTNAATGVSSVLNVAPGSRVYNYCSATGMNDKATSCQVVQYDINGVFIERTGILNKDYRDLNASTYIVRFIFGYLASSGNTETQEDINENFSVQIVAPAVDENDLRWIQRNNVNLIDANNYASMLPDLSAVNTNIIYRLNFAVGSTNIPLNTPYGNSWKSSRIVLFETFAKSPGSLSTGDTQLFIGDDGIYKRNFTDQWMGWELIASAETSKTITVDPNGGGDYTSFTEAIAEAQNLKNAVVYVKRGTYDAIAEAKALFGNDYFDNWGTSYGPISLRNGIKVICEPGTILEAHYTGDSDAVMAYYSPVNFKWDATLEGLTIKASRVRYCIHDDQWNDTTPYKHYLKNVRLEIDNTQSTWTRRQAFGGGLGVNGYIQFDNCYFKAAGLNGSEYSGYSSCSFHNSPAANAQGKIVMNNCYFADNSGFRFSYYGASQLISEAFLSGCSFGHAIEIVPESASASVENVAVIDCNNVVRSA